MQDGALQYSESLFNCHLSFRPLVDSLRKNIDEGNPGLKILYGDVVKEFESFPELMGAITDLSVLDKHTELIQELLSAVFPPTTANYMYGVTLPFNHYTVYASPLFKKLLVRTGTKEMHIPEGVERNELNREKLHFALGLVLKKYIGYKSPENSRSVYPFFNSKTGLTRYMELRIDGRFIDVKPVGEMPEMPKSIINPHTNSIMTISELMEHVPLEKFVFEGLSVIRVNDMTETEVITKIKNRLLDINSISDSSVYTELEYFVQCLTGLKESAIGITPFFKINGHYVYSDLHNTNSILFRHFHSTADKDEISDYCKLMFRENDLPVLYETLNKNESANLPCLQYYYKEGARSIILCPRTYHKWANRTTGNCFYCSGAIKTHSC